MKSGQLPLGDVAKITNKSPQVRTRSGGQLATTPKTVSRQMPKTALEKQKEVLARSQKPKQMSLDLSGKAKKAAGNMARKGAKVAVNKVKEKMNKPKAAAPQTKTPPQKKSDSPQSVEMKRMRQRYIERQKQNKAQAEKDKTKGGFMGGVRKSLGGDLISKDPDKRREARFNRGKEMADGVKSKIGSLRKIRLQPPSTDTGYSPSEDLRGGAARKFGSSAS